MSEPRILTARAFDVLREDGTRIGYVIEGAPEALEELPWLALSLSEEGHDFVGHFPGPREAIGALVEVCS